MNSTAVAIALAGALTYFAVAGVVDGAKWVGHQAKRGGAAVVHVVKKVAHR